MAEILVVGSVNPTIAMRYERSDDSKIRAYECKSTLGGTAYNVARLLCNLGRSHEIVLYPLVGPDPMGDVVFAQLGSVTHDQPLRWRPTTAIAVVDLPDGGPHRTVGYKESADLRTEHVRRLQAISHKEAPSIIVCAGLMMGEEWIAETLFDSAPNAVRVLCPDILSCKNGTLDAALERTTLLVMNDEEARAFFGSDDPEAIRKRVSCTVVITRAERGALLLADDGAVIDQPIPHPVAVKHPVGAGDAFLAMLLHTLLLKCPPEQALCAAVAAGTSHVAGERVNA